MLALVFLGQYLRGLALSDFDVQIHEICQDDPDCERIHQLYQGKDSEKLALGYFIVLAVFILFVVVFNFRSVFYLKYNLLMKRLTKMRRPAHNDSPRVTQLARLATSVRSISEMELGSTKSREASMNPFPLISTASNNSGIKRMNSFKQLLLERMKI